LLLAVADPTEARRRLERRLPMGLRPRPLIEDLGRSVMADENVELIRHACRACADGDRTAVLEWVDPDLEWTYLDPPWAPAQLLDQLWEAVAAGAVGVRR
jgi:hypothetical protein